MVAQDNYDTSGLLHLLKASSKQSVAQCCHHVLSLLEGSNARSATTDNICKEVNIGMVEGEELCGALEGLVGKIVYKGTSSCIKDLLPDDFHPNLRDLLTKVISSNLEEWKTRMLQCQVSFPKLLNFDWRLEKDNPSRAPSCVVNFETSDKTMEVDMSRETLDTMLGSLSKIRDQISSIAK